MRCSRARPAPTQTLAVPRVVALQAPECPQLGAPQGVGRGGATLLAIDMKQPLGEVDLRPNEVHELRDPQSMPVGQENKGGIPVAVAPALSGRLHQGPPLLGQEVLAGAALHVFYPPWGQPCHFRWLGENQTWVHTPH